MTPFAVYLAAVITAAGISFAVVYLCERREQRSWDAYCAERWVRLQRIDDVVGRFRDELDELPTAERNIQ